MPMLLYEFNALKDDEKAEYVWEHGKHVLNYKGRESSFSLYITPDFYAEFELKEDKIINIRSFKQGALLDLYIDRVDLTKLINE
jgi:hypothetical protein